MISSSSFAFSSYSPIGCNESRQRNFQPVSAISYKKFIDFALDETKNHTHLVTSPLQDSHFLLAADKTLDYTYELKSGYCLQGKYNRVASTDGRSDIELLSFQAPKIRFLRSLSIENEALQVLDFAAFSEPEFDVPIFCANIFTAASTNIVVLDLNPLYDVVDRRDYKEKYYKSLLPLGFKYANLLPWGGKLTSESLKFFSPIVIWTKFSSSQSNYDILYTAFIEYYKVWLELMDDAAKEIDPSRIILNRDAQHRYLSWRAEKDPGHGVLKKLIGETRAKDLIRNFLFNGIDELGSKEFLDYFPEYRCEDGTINEKRSMIGKSYEARPWDERGEFIGNCIEI